MKSFNNGLLYKLNSLNDNDKEKVLLFLNNQKSNTKSLHHIILAHINEYGTGDIDSEMQAKMVQGNTSKSDVLPNTDNTSFEKPVTEVAKEEIKQDPKQESTQKNDMKIDTSKF